MGWFLLVAATLAAPSQGAPLGQEIERLPDLIKAGRWTEASALARSIEARIANLAPLEVLDGQALREPALGLGIYERLDGGVVHREELFLYAQIRNHGLQAKKNGFELVLVSDLIILDATGKELARDEGFGQSRFTARAEHRDTFVNIALRVKGLPSGKYTARLVVHDRIKGSSGRIEIPFAMP
ncbi:MAG: hypothetical protein V3T05_06785 [Myxococcota bacterium]